MPEPITIISGTFGILSVVVSSLIGFASYVNKNKQTVRDLKHQEIENKIKEVIEDQNDILDRVKVLEQDNRDYFRKRVLQIEKGEK